MSLAPIDILVVEDNPGDVLLIKKAFARSDKPHVIHVVGDGQAALDFVRRVAPHEAAPRPDLILLDINLPRLNGLEVLENLKQDPDLLHIPVVMLSSSEREADINNAYANHANSYITKPSSLPGLMAAIKHLEQYWFVVVRRPS